VSWRLSKDDGIRGSRAAGSDSHERREREGASFGLTVLCVLGVQITLRCLIKVCPSSLHPFLWDRDVTRVRSSRTPTERAF
jgi:hypothetical protein